MLLAIETSGRVGAVALADTEGVLEERPIDSALGTAAGLAPAIKRLLDAHQVRPAQLRALGVSVGPGSFTGLRVGVTTAKALGYALSIPVVSVDTPRALAEQCPELVGEVWTIIDAQRGQVYASRFRRDASGLWHPAGPAALVDTEALAGSLAAEDWVTGPGCALLPRGGHRASVAPEEHWEPRASTIARIALRKLASGETEDVLRLAPRYARRPAAVERADPAT